MTDKCGRNSERFPISDELYKQILKETLQRSLTLLNSADILLDNEGDETVCAGIYSYAVEEYGKFFVLKQSGREDGNVIIKYSEEFTKHAKKFGLALSSLPPECINLGEFGFEKGFEQGFERGKTILNFKARMAVFYTDFTDSRDRVKPIPPVNKTNLKNAINKLRMLVLNES